ncbi:hypothetical protein BKA70DRAFT_1115336 [Coprinopsis sp. MPI-PUGE-AT-0042]|nr:hypothetical protein BKA70DRAFT_1115336 [Coprinopsis sp. MPI-PUGE-AT-0042]
MSLLHGFGGYISGSAALASIPGLNTFTPNDLDFYFPEEAAEPVLDFFLSTRKGSFTFERGAGLCDKPSGTSIPGVSRIWWLAVSKTDKNINIILTSTRSALAPILGFHSTIVMNVICHFGVISLYSKPTRYGVGWTNIDHGLTNRDGRWFNKYKDRNYRLFQDSRMQGLFGRHVCGAHVYCAHTIRCLQDDGVQVYTFPAYSACDHSELLIGLEHQFRWRLKNSGCRWKVDNQPGFVATDDERLDF